jgi:hypothetical protein
MASKIARKLSPRRAVRRVARRAVIRTKRKAKTWLRGHRVKVKPARAAKTAKKAVAPKSTGTSGKKPAAPRKAAAPRAATAKPTATQRAVNRAAQRSKRSGREAKAARGVARGTVPMAAMSAYATTGPAAMQLGTISGRPNRRGIPSARRAQRRGDCPWCRGLGHAPMLTPQLRCQPCNGTGRAHPAMSRPTGRYRAVAFEAWQPDIELAHSGWCSEDPVGAQLAAAKLIASLIHRKRPAAVLRWRIEHHR